jgi:hypothetical protein
VTFVFRVQHCHEGAGKCSNGAFVNTRRQTESDGEYATETGTGNGPVAVFVHALQSTLAPGSRLDQLA